MISDLGTILLFIFGVCSLFLIGAFISNVQDTASKIINQFLERLQIPRWVNNKKLSLVDRLNLIDGYQWNRCANILEKKDVGIFESNEKDISELKVNDDIWFIDGCGWSEFKPYKSYIRSIELKENETVYHLGDTFPAWDLPVKHGHYKRICTTEEDAKSIIEKIIRQKCEDRIHEIKFQNNFKK